MKLGNAGRGKDPNFWCAFEVGEVRVIGDEPGNTRKDPDPSEKAISQGEGGARLPFLCALRQDLSRGHSAPRLWFGPRERGRTWSGRDRLRADRAEGPGGVAGGLARGPGLEEVPARSGAAGENTETRGRRATARHSDAPSITHLIQFALGMMGEDARSLSPIFAD